LRRPTARRDTAIADSVEKSATHCGVLFGSLRRHRVRRNGFCVASSYLQRMVNAMQGILAAGAIGENRRSLGFENFDFVIEFDFNWVVHWCFAFVVGRLGAED
jgi:hypothetical protein